jgi:hypothetical protein
MRRASEKVPKDGAYRGKIQRTRRTLRVAMGERMLKIPGLAIGDHGFKWFSTVLVYRAE